MGKVRKNLAVLASGSGTTLQAVIDAIESKSLGSQINIVISDKADAFALHRATTAGIPIHVISAKDSVGIDEELSNVLANYEIDLVVLAGYLKMIGPKMIESYDIINTHPSLLPKYGGKGMHGMHVHEAIVANGETETGVTVHWVDAEYDHGNIIRQTAVPVYKEDVADDVSARVQLMEKAQLVSVLTDFSAGKIE